jgi:hypothetical protein
MSLATSHRRSRGESDRDATPIPALTARVMAVLHQASLDRQLACGADPGARAQLQARAWHLTRTGMRCAMAQRLEQIVAEVDRPALPRIAAVPVCRDEVRAARSELLRVAALLRESHQVDAAGVALVRRLLSDGSGPLYWPRAHDDLYRQVHNVAERLERASWDLELK